MDKENICQIVVTHVSDILDITPNDISMDRSMSDYGANSIDRLEVVTACLEQLDLEVPLSQFAQVKNLAGLAEALLSHLKTGACSHSVGE